MILQEGPTASRMYQGFKIPGELDAAMKRMKELRQGDQRAWGAGKLAWELECRESKDDHKKRARNLASAIRPTNAMDSTNTPIPDPAPASSTKVTASVTTSIPRPSTGTMSEY